MPPETCPNCGADVPRNSKACPECGADERTGWSEQAAYDGLGLPDEEFNYNQFVKAEFGEGKSAKRGPHWLVWVVAAMVVALAFALLSW